jgi:hypothetical protein
MNSGKLINYMATSGNDQNGIQTDFFIETVFRLNTEEINVRYIET